MFTIYDLVGKALSTNIPTFERAIELAKIAVMPRSIHTQVSIWEDGNNLGKIAQVDARPGMDWVSENFLFARPHGEHPSMGKCDCNLCQWFDSAHKI